VHRSMAGSNHSHVKGLDLGKALEDDGAQRHHDLGVVYRFAALITRVSSTAYSSSLARCEPKQSQVKRILSSLEVGNHRLGPVNPRQMDEL